jgi:hypothetical protein
MQAAGKLDRCTTAANAMQAVQTGTSMHLAAEVVCQLASTCKSIRTLFSQVSVCSVQRSYLVLHSSHATLHAELLNRRHACAVPCRVQTCSCTLLCTAIMG